MGDYDDREGVVFGHGMDPHTQYGCIKPGEWFIPSPRGKETTEALIYMRLDDKVVGRGGCTPIGVCQGRVHGPMGTTCRYEDHVRVRRVIPRVPIEWWSIDDAIPLSELPDD